MIKDNYLEVKNNVENKTCESNRALEDVTLIAVSKTMPIEYLKEAYEAGARDFGENKVQEIIEKYPLMPADVKWHMIGHLQTNKVKYIIDKVYMIHSVDSVKLAKEISKQAVKAGVVSNILLEVNVANEESKFGFSCQEVIESIEEIAALPNICIRGLMTVAPFVNDAIENTMIFRTLKQLSVDINLKKVDNVNMDCLSMGMSGDYLVAIAEGATHVRVGTSIFGKREYDI